MSYFFSEGARAEHLEHVAYYENQRPGLGERYLAAFESAMKRACAYPDRFPSESADGIHRIRIPGFPFNILYRCVRDQVEVLVVAHHRRRPHYWRTRA